VEAIRNDRHIFAGARAEIPSAIVRKLIEASTLVRNRSVAPALSRCGGGDERSAREHREYGSFEHKPPRGEMCICHATPLNFDSLTGTVRHDPCEEADVLTSWAKLPQDRLRPSNSDSQTNLIRCRLRSSSDVHGAGRP